MRPGIHIFVCAAIFAFGMVAYHEYRAHVFDVARLGYTPSYTGEQVFYDPYIDAADFGIKLGPEIGPNMAKVDAALREKLSPVPAESELLRASLDQNTAQFNEANFGLTVPELVERIWRQPNYEYSMVIDGAVDDATLLRAAIEIAEAHPLYIAAYTWRNLWNFMVFPGWSFSRGNNAGYVLTGLTFYAAGVDLTEAELLGPRASAETRVPQKYCLAMALARVAWRCGYYAFILATTLLTAAGWFAIISAPFLYSRSYVGVYAAATGLLLYNALVVSMFVGPDNRYEAMTLVLRATVAALGLIALWPKRKLA